VKADQLAVEGMDWLATDIPASRLLEVSPQQTLLTEKDMA
jgi:peptide/nickel transport system permease protein